MRLNWEEIRLLELCKDTDEHKTPGIYQVGVLRMDVLTHMRAFIYTWINFAQETSLICCKESSICTPQKNVVCMACMHATMHATMNAMHWTHGQERDVRTDARVSK